MWTGWGRSRDAHPECRVCGLVLTRTVKGRRERFAAPVGAARSWDRTDA